METMGEDYQSRNLRALDFKFIEINE